MYARQRFVACCKAFQLQAIDSVYIDIKDLDGLQKQSEEGVSCRHLILYVTLRNLSGLGRAWGFTGKQTIHPTQVC